MTSQTWVEFVGDGRSGHTVVAAILDAHQHIRISEEQKWLSKWNTGAISSRDEVIAGVLACGMGKERKRYTIDGQAQLTYTPPLLVLGDKCGWSVVSMMRNLTASPCYYSRFGEFMGMPIKLIRTIRNPFDHIASGCVSPKYKRLYPDDEIRIQMMIWRYSMFCHDADFILDYYARDGVFTIYNDELISDPIGVVSSLFKFLEVPTTEDQVRAFAAVVLKEPNRKSHLMKWSDANRRQVEKVIQKYDYLASQYEGLKP